jgi:GNAT superfamily N-acetyltransferase
VSDPAPPSDTRGEHLEWRRDRYRISTDPALLDRDLIHAFLSEEAYWSPGVSRTVVERQIDNALCFGLYEQSVQVGFARVVTDRAAIGYLADVFVVSSHRGRGLGKWLIEVVLGHPDLQGLRRLFLGTADAHSLYRRFGFRPLPDPERMLSIERPPEEPSSGQPTGD